MAPSAIVTNKLTKRFGDVVAVDSVDLDVHVGEVYGFLGPNGAGKSTTIRCLLDLGRPSSGSATVLGLDSVADSVEIHRRVGYLPGDLALYPKLTGAEMLEYFANLRGGVDPRAVRELADRFGTDLSKRCADYSSGNRQKVGLIQAFMHRPDLLILDEPSTGLDPLVQHEFHDLVAETVAEGRTVFLSSHTLSEVERVAERVGIIRHGRLVEVASMHDLKAKAIRRLELEFAIEPDVVALKTIDGVREVTGTGRRLTIAYEGSPNRVLAEATRIGIVSLTSRDADLEEIFLAYYHDDEATDAAV